MVEHDCYRIWHDGPILRVDALGVWDLAVARSYSATISAVIAEMRRDRPLLRAIVDRRDHLGYEPGVSELLLETYRDVLRQGDRVALVVASSVAKGNARRVAAREETQAFLSMATARTWVLAYG